MHVFSITLAIAVVAGSGTAQARDTTTARIGDVAAALTSSARCGEVMEAILNATATPTETQMLLTLLSIVYIQGLADGRGETRQDAMRDVMRRCAARPDALFRSVPAP